MVARAGGAQDQSLKQRQGEELQNDNRFQLWGFGTGAETNVARRDHASTELTCGCATQEPTAFHRAPHFFFASASMHQRRSTPQFGFCTSLSPW